MVVPDARPLNPWLMQFLNEKLRRPLDPFRFRIYEDDQSYSSGLDAEKCGQLENVDIKAWCSGPVGHTKQVGICSGPGHQYDPHGVRDHIPMMDFITSDPLVIQKWKFAHERICQWTIVKTDRSFHAWGHTAIPWRDLIGRLIGMDLSHPEWRNIVDLAWIGCSLIRGFGALRITSNCGRAPLERFVP